MKEAAKASKVARSASLIGETEIEELLLKLVARSMNVTRVTSSSKLRLPLPLGLREGVEAAPVG